MCSSPIIIYDVTVVTGLEKLAIQEIQQKIPDILEIKQTVGHVTFKSSNGFDLISKLCSVDNIYVVIFEKTITDLKNSDPIKLAEILLPLVDECDWKTGLNIWKEANQFDDSLYNIDEILDPNNESRLPSFRVSCNRTGDHHQFTSQEASCLFGGQVNDKFHWKVQLKNFDLEILMTIKNDWLRISLCLTKQSLFRRHIVSYGLTTLRGTIAYNLIQIAQIQPGDLICDPLCGSGVIPIELAINWPETFTIAGDIHQIAIEKSSENFQANQLQNRTNILNWDTTRLPLRDNSIDAFITDLPFGKRMGSKHINKKLYPQFIKEMIRCTRLDGRIVLLTQDKSNANKTIHCPMVKTYCRLERAFFANIGGLDASIYLLRRNSNKFCQLKNKDIEII